MFTTMISMDPVGARRCYRVTEAYAEGLSKFTLGLEARRLLLIEYIESRRSGRAVDGVTHQAQLPESREMEISAAQRLEAIFTQRISTCTAKWAVNIEALRKLSGPFEAVQAIALVDETYPRCVSVVQNIEIGPGSFKPPCAQGTLRPTKA